MSDSEDDTKKMSDGSSSPSFADYEILLELSKQILTEDVETNRSQFFKLQFELLFLFESV